MELENYVAWLYTENLPPDPILLLSPNLPSNVYDCGSTGAVVGLIFLIKYLTHQQGSCEEQVIILINLFLMIGHIVQFPQR